MEGGSDSEQLINPTSDEEESDVELAGCGASPLCDPNHKCHRFIALILMSLLGFGSYFCYDNPSALQDNFISDLDLTTSDFVLLYSLYSWPNVILCFVGGFLMDSVFGIRLGTIMFCILLVIGQVIVAMGGIMNIFWLMCAGRFIFGIGGESLAVAQNNYAVLWFKGKELNMVFGLQMSFARVGSTVNFALMQPLYNYINQYYKGYTCTGIVLFIASLTTILSLIAAIALAWMDKRADRILKRTPPREGEVVRLSDVKDFPAIFWLITIVCVAYYVAIFPFIALGKVFFIRKYKFSPNDANILNSIIYTISAVISPFAGYLIDKTGKNVFWVTISILISIGCHGLLAFSFINPYIPMIILGIAYSMLASGLWPLVALVIPEYQLGTAYGITQSVQNLGLAVASMICGQIVDSAGYLILELFFLGCLCASLIVTLLIWIFDANSTGLLNMTPEQREIFERNRIASMELDREKLLASGSMADVTPQDLLQPHSDFHIRNRYLSRIGATLPSNYNVNLKGLTYRALR